MIDYYHVLPGDVRQYFKRRSELCYSKSTFDICKRENCNICCSDTVGVKVSAFDLIAMALVSGKPVDEIFRGYMKIKFDTFESVGKIKTEIVLDMPCGFLSEYGCTIQRDDVTGKYVGKPIACVLFPENIIFANQFGISDETKEKMPQLFSIENKNYPCMKDKPAVSKDRAIILLNLEDVSNKESAVTNHYFGFSSAIIPEKILEKKDVEEAKIFFNGFMKEFGSRYAKGQEGYKMIEEKAAQLNTREGVQRLFSLFQVIQ